MFVEMTSHLKKFGYLFYAIDPRDTFYDKVEDVPDYMTEAIPYFISLIIIEQLVIIIKMRKVFALNDAITSLAQGLFMQQTK